MAPNLKILAIDSSYDEITHAFCVYRNKHVYPYMESKGFEIIRCQDKFARRTYVEQEIYREDIVYMTGVGHGIYTTYMGEDCNPIFDIGNYQPQESDSKVVHFFACQTAAELGTDFVKNGCLTYFGYVDNLIIPKEFSLYKNFRLFIKLTFKNRQINQDFHLSL